jgi:hypothetical protein
MSAHAHARSGARRVRKRATDKIDGHGAALVEACRIAGARAGSSIIHHAWAACPERIPTMKKNET